MLTYTNEPKRTKTIGNKIYHDKHGTNINTYKLTIEDIDFLPSWQNSANLAEYCQRCSAINECELNVILLLVRHVCS